MQDHEARRIYMYICSYVCVSVCRAVVPRCTGVPISIIISLTLIKISDRQIGKQAIEVVRCITRRRTQFDGLGLDTLHT